MRTNKKTYGDFPTIEQIKEDYNELMEIIKDVKTAEDAIKIAETKKLTIEINGMSIEEYKARNNVNARAIIYTDENGVEEGIEWIRYELYGCLSYIYDRFDGKPSFDIWSSKCDFDFIEDVTIDEVTEENYKNWLKPYQAQEIEISIEDLWMAACNGRLNVLKNYFESEKKELNRRYTRFGGEHSLIMGAYRNNQFDVVDYLMSIGETITTLERKDIELELKKRSYMEKLMNGGF